MFFDYFFVYHTPPEALASLAKREFASSGAHADVAVNPNTAPETLALLVKKGFYYGVAKNLNTPPKSLTLLAKKGDVHVRRDVALNPNTPPEAFVSLRDRGLKD